MSDWPTRQQEEEMADRLLDSQIADYEEERWARRHAARWPTGHEYNVQMDRIGPPPENLTDQKETER